MPGDAPRDRPAGPRQDDSWSYEETTMLMIRGVPEPFMHTDRHTLKRVLQPTPNPMAIATEKRRAVSGIARMR